MLERTAASLEPCSLQRVLPSAKRPLKNRRQLRSGFWRHGAVNIELFDACQTLLRAPLLDLPPVSTSPPSAPARTKSEVTLSSMNASAFLLDFLYPQGAANILRRLSPGGLERREQSVKRYGSLNPRVHATPISSAASLDRLPSVGDTGDGAMASEKRHAARSQKVDDTEFYAAFEEPLRWAVDSVPETLHRLLREKDPVDKYSRIWSLYIELEEDLEPRFRTRVMLELSQSPNPSEAWKVAGLFSRYRPEEWTEEIVKAAISADLATENVDQAVSTFRKALEVSGLVQGFDALLAHFLRTSNWDLVIQSWQAVSTHVDYFPKGQDDEPALNELANTASAEAALVATNLDSPRPSRHNGATGVADRGILEDSVQVNNRAAPGLDESTRVPAVVATQDAPPDRSGPSWAITFERTAKLYGLAGKLLELYAFFESGDDADRAKRTCKAIDRLVSLMRRNSLPFFQPQDATFLVERIGDPLKGYPRLVFAFLSRREEKEAVEIYRKYRQLPNSTVVMRMLPLMLDIFYPDDLTGVEQVRHDWKQIGDEGMDRKAYTKFLTFYARHGDVRSLYEFWAEHHGGFENQDPEIFASFLRVHAAHGDVDEVQKLLDRALKKSGRGPTIAERNILLQAHARVRDYDGALRVFTEICDNGEPNTHTFVLLMQLASSLGDLEFCLDMSRLADDYNLQPTADMVDTLIEAYCQNERYIEAERLCIRSTEQGRFDKKVTMLWNTLLRHHGFRRDLTTVTRLLNTMSSYKLPYNNETYDQLLNALVYCKQAHHAMHLLRMAETEGIFEPTLHQYILLMTAFMRTGEPHMVIRVHETMMQNKHFPESAQRMTKVIEACGKWFKMPRNQLAGKSSQWFINRALDTFKKSLGREDRTAIDDSRSVSQQYSKMVSVLVEARDFGSAQEVVELYRSQFTKRAKDEELPIHLLSSMMLADYYERKFSRAKSTWELIVKQLTDRGRPARSRIDQETDLSEDCPRELSSTTRPLGSHQTVGLLPRLRYSINEPLRTMQRILVVEKNPYGLESLVKRVQDAGFLIDSANWNYYVQAQARLKQWKEAFKTCEVKLMPRWGGWYSVRQKRGNKHQLPLEARRLGSSPRHLRPIAHTLFVLAKEYLDLEKMTPWSRHAAEVFEMLKNECPKVVEAVTSLIRDPESQLENDIFAGLWEPEIQDLAGDIKARRQFSDDDMAREAATQRDTRNPVSTTEGEERGIRPAAKANQARERSNSQTKTSIVE
ncbi:hypothetical protein GQ53DRAFT_669462 [Thozetella sp. PMI_491]|nr:hypothetical protein GQ53DRAFT_669462 [Thozetella sp. PMI_491]